MSENIAADRTAGCLTTHKLQALLDSGLMPGIRCRKSLAQAMTDAGDKISVHGVEGWFKNVDSNYALERESLHPEHRSYLVPKRRWSVILSLFEVSSDDLRQIDDQFRDTCFTRKRSKPHSGDGDTSRFEMPLLFVLYAADDGEELYDEFLWLRHRGFNIWWDNSANDTSVWSAPAASVIESADACLLYESKSFRRSTRCARELQLVEDNNLPVFIARLDESSLGFALRTEPKGIIRRGPTSSPVYRDQLLATLHSFYGDSPSQASTPADSARALAQSESIAVLPIANFSGAEALTFIAQGITEDLSTMLARIPELLVSSRVASQAFAGVLAQYSQLQKELGVRYVVEGSVRPSRDQVRLNVGLTDLQQGVQLWADQFDGSFEDIYDAEDQIVASICSQLKLLGQRSMLHYGARTGNIDCWRYFHLGWFKSFVEPAMPSLQDAIDCFESALTYEPDYALAHAGLANALGTGMLWGGVGPERYDELKDHALRAYELLPTNPSVLYARGMMEFVGTEPLENALVWVEKAVNLEPSNAAYLAARAYLLAQTGRHDEGLELCKKVRLVSAGDLRQPFINYMVSNVHIGASQFELGARTMLESEGLKTVDFVWFVTGYAWFMLDNLPAAAEAVQQMLSGTHRPLSLFTYSLHNRLWPQHDAVGKQAYLSFCEEQGLR
ncbi:MAG: hypothetical protein AAGC91_12315 [Pseudomonadota bacterium]